MAPLNRANIDTDAIIPKQFLKSINRTGFGPNLFDEWRYLDYAEPGKDCGNRPLNPDFILNTPSIQLLHKLDYIPPLIPQAGDAELRTLDCDTGTVAPLAGFSDSYLDNVFIKE